MQCFACKSERVEKAATIAEHVFGMVVVCVKTPVMRCANCGEETIEFDDGRRAELAVAKTLADYGALEPEAFRFMRKVLEISAKEFAGFLGVAPETVSRWENAASPLDRGAWQLLSTMVDERFAGEDRTLKRLRRPAPPATRQPMRLEASAA